MAIKHKNLKLFKSSDGPLPSWAWISIHWASPIFESASWSGYLPHTMVPQVARVTPVLLHGCISLASLSLQNQLEFSYLIGNALSGIWTQISKFKSRDATIELNSPDIALHVIQTVIPTFKLIAISTAISETSLSKFVNDPPYRLRYHNHPWSDDKS